MKSKFKKVISTCLAAVMLLSTAVIAPLTVTAAETQAIGTGKPITTIISGDFEYELLDDGTAEITGYTGSATELTIPSELDGKKVTSIGLCAFLGCASLASITIPDSVTSIDWEAFSGCTSLTSIAIPDSVTEIGFGTFENCKSLTSIIIPDSVTNIGDSAFNGCTSLTSVTIPDSVAEIGYGAFENTAWYDNQPDGVVYAGKVLYKCKGEMPQNTTITVKEGTKGISDNAFEDCISLASVTIPDSVTSIGARAFSNCTSLANIYVDSKNPSYTVIDGVLFDKEVKTLICYPIGKKSSSYSIPDSVTSIGDYAFLDCDNLTSVTIPDSVTEIGYYAFGNCTSLTSITISDSVTSIGDQAFCGCTSLTSITIPDSVTSIGDSAFCYCTSLASITIPDSVTEIGGGAFEDCTSLTSVTIPDSVTEIGGGAFFGCTSLTSITIPASVEYINYHAFGYYYDDEYNEFKIDGFTITGYSGSAAETYANDNGFEFISLGDLPAEFFLEYELTDNGEIVITDYTGSATELTIPSEIDGKKVTSIGDSAFRYCESLTSITIPDSVTSIGYSAFSGCTSLTSITIPDSVTEIGYWAFSGCTSLTSITIPDSVTRIGACAFWDCTSLTGITIPDSVTNFGDNAFRNCTSLTSITIPNSVTSIGDTAFFDCTSLTSVTIPNSVTEIGERAFENCTSLASITIPDSVTSIGDDAFGYYYDDEYNEFKIDGFTITGYSGSAAETYANDNGFKFISLGEVPTTEPTTEPATTEPATEPATEPTTEPTEPTTVITDKDTNVSVEGDIPEGVELNVESAEAVVENAVAAYNITLEKDGKAVQPDGKVTVKLPVPDGVDGSQCKVYYMDGDSKTDMNAVFVDGYLVFETDHFSVYAVVKTEKTSVLLGDVNGDGKVNIKDATTIQKSAASLVTLTEKQNKVADVNVDGKVNVNDATAIQKFVAGIDTGFEIGK